MLSICTCLSHQLTCDIRYKKYNICINACSLLTRMPMVMNSWNCVLKAPRRWKGASSERNSGPHCTAIPTPAVSDRRGNKVNRCFQPARRALSMRAAASAKALSLIAGRQYCLGQKPRWLQNVPVEQDTHAGAGHV